MANFMQMPEGLEGEAWVNWYNQQGGYDKQPNFQSNADQHWQSGTGADAQNFVAATPEWQQAAATQRQDQLANQSLEQIASNLNSFQGNTSFLSGMPQWRVGDQASEDAIKAYTGAANAGGSFQGLGAFLRSGPEYVYGQGGDVDSAGYYDSRTTKDADELAKRLGLGPIDWGKESQFVNAGGYTGGVLAQMNDMLKDYRLISGLTQDTNDPERLMNEALYKNINGVWTPISGRQIQAPEHHGWARTGPGSDFLTAMSLVAPAIGGVIGAGGAAAAGGGGGITGTGGMSGIAAYGGTGGSTLSGLGGTGLAGGLSGTASAIAPTLGTAATGATGLAGGIANQLGVGGQFSSLPTWAQGALNGAVQGGVNSTLSGNNPLTGALTGGLTGGLGDTIKGLGLGGTGTGALQGALTGSIGSAIGGKNPLTGGLLGGLGGGVSGGLRDLGAGADVGNMGGKFVSQIAGNYIQDQIKNEVFQGRQDLMNGLYQEAANRGVDRQTLDAFLRTAQGRQAVQRLIAQQGKGSLQSLFG